MMTQLTMATAGTQRLSIDSTGVVDIESAKLEIAGAAGSAIKYSNKWLWNNKLGVQTVL